MIPGAPFTAAPIEAGYTSKTDRTSFGHPICFVCLLLNGVQARVLLPKGVSRILCKPTYYPVLISRFEGIHISQVRVCRTEKLFYQVCLIRILPTRLHGNQQFVQSLPSARFRELLEVNQQFSQLQLPGQWDRPSHGCRYRMLPNEPG